MSKALLNKNMRSALILSVFFALVLCTSAVNGKNSISKKSAEKAVKKYPKAPFAECISPTSDYMNRKLRKYLHMKMQPKDSNNASLIPLEFHPLFLCPLAEVAEPGHKYGEFFPGVKVFQYKFKKAYRYKSQYYKEFEKKYGPIITKYSSLLVAAIGRTVLPYGCSWNYKRVNCVFVTEKFFQFIRLLAKFGNLQPMEIEKLMPFLQKLHQSGFRLDF